MFFSLNEEGYNFSTVFDIYRKQSMNPVEHYRLESLFLLFEMIKASMCDSLPHILLFMPSVSPCGIKHCSTLTVYWIIVLRLISQPAVTKKTLSEKNI